METSETVLSICMGIGLAAACGFRIFVPLLIIGLAAHAGHLALAPGFVWIGSTPAVICLAVATVLEIIAYYVPWLDNALDTLATPCAIIAGTIVVASMVGDMSPWLKWTLAVIAGGGAAGLVQAGTVLTRGVSTASTGGLANPVVATAELGGSVALGSLAVFAPMVAVASVPFIVGFAGWKVYSRKPQQPTDESEPS